VKNVEGLVHMESVLMVHIGIDFDPTPHQRAALCYYYGTYDIEEAVDRCRSGDYHEGEEGFLIYVPSLHSPEMAPPGHHAITVYTIAPYILSKGDWASRREELADKLLIEAEKIIPGLRERSKTEVIMTPLDFKSRIFVEKHSFGGLAPIMNQQNPPHHTPIEGLWYVGAQSESGGGVAGVVAGTRKAILKLLNEI
jgi:phytoene dehydrogenase-like protein